MTEPDRVSHGVDLDAFESYAEHAAEHPEEVQFTLGARSTYEGTCAHSLAKVDAFELGGQEIRRDTREYTIPYGAWREVEEAGGWVGPTDRLEPIEAALSALASCINVGISINALANGVDVEHLETNVRTDFDPAVLFGLADLDASDSVFENLQADVEIEAAGADDGQIEEWAERAPVYALVSLAQEIDVAVSPATKVAGDD